MNQILEKIDRIFNREGVHTFSFKEGHPLEDMIKKEHEVVEQVITEDESKELTVCETKKVGYYMEGLENSKNIIRPAKVSVYSPKPKENLTKEQSVENEEKE